jgi:enoyl-CoA hydratase/carnithine racemase
MFNPFANRAFDIGGPARDYAPVTPDDAAPLPQVGVGLYVEVGGAVRFLSEGGLERTVEVSDYGWILCGVRKVFATGTTASGIHALSVG